MKIVATIKHLSSFPPKIIIAKIWNRLNQQKRLKRLQNLYLNSDSRSFTSTTVANLFPLVSMDGSAVKWDVKNPTFDLLGSGPIQNTYDEEAAGLENYHYPNNFPTKTIDTQWRFSCQCCTSNSFTF